MNLPSDATSSILFFALYLWIIVWQGLSLWQSARQDQKNWFVACLVLNGLTIGILGIVYVFFFAKKRMRIKDLMFWETK